MEGLTVKKLGNYSFYFLIINASCFFNLSFAADYSGYFKSYPVLKSPVNKSKVTSLSNALKFQVNTNLVNDIKFEASYELTLMLEKPSAHAEKLNTYRLIDLKSYLHDEKPNTNHKITLLQNLNRFNFNIITSEGDLTIGRTPVAFGVAKSISPNDILTPMAFNTIDKEERTGVDSIIFKRPLTQEILLDAGVVLGADAKGSNSAFYLRPKLSRESLDLSLSLVHFKNKNSLGFELSHPIKDAGFWIDASYLTNNQTKYKDFFRGTTGIDYKFKNSFYLAAEYHYNGSSLGKSYPYPEDFIYLRDEHYGIFTMSYELTPLIILSGQSYHNLKDNSMFLMPKAEYNLTDNSYLGLGFYLGTGNNLQSELGRASNTYYASYRYYF